MFKLSGRLESELSCPYFENFLKANQAYVELHGDLHLSIKPQDQGCNRKLVWIRVYTLRQL